MIKLFTSIFRPSTSITSFPPSWFKCKQWKRVEVQDCNPRHQTISNHSMIQSET